MRERRTSGPTDALSDALTRMRLRAFINVALDAGETWAVDFPSYEGFTFNVVEKGECLLSVGGDQQPLRFRAGDCFLLPGGREFSLESTLSPSARLRAEDLFPRAHDGHVLCNGGGHFLVIGTIFRFEGHLPSMLFDRLPPVISIDGSSDQAAVLRWNLERFGAEMRGTGMGRSLILSHLALILLLQVLRIYLQSSPTEANWLTALSNPRLAMVLEAMQTDYKRDWSVDDLAKLAHMSRSGFALVFKRSVGVTPLVYLMNWRMQIACDLLRRGHEGLAAIASLVGYASESAFSAAFAKTLKVRPGEYRRAKKSS